VSDQVTHPYKTRGKFIVLYIMNFIFCDSKLEGRRQKAEGRRFYTEWSGTTCTTKHFII
jgi:hypothetical protein